MVYFHTNADEMSPDNTFKIPSAITDQTWRLRTLREYNTAGILLVYHRPPSDNLKLDAR